MEKWFNVGKIVNTHGIRGEVRVISRTDFLKNVIRLEIHCILFMQKTKNQLHLTIDITSNP